MLLFFMQNKKKIFIIDSNLIITVFRKFALIFYAKLKIFIIVGLLIITFFKYAFTFHAKLKIFIIVSLLIITFLKYMLNFCFS